MSKRREMLQTKESKSAVPVALSTMSTKTADFIKTFAARASGVKK